jgi:ubiquinone/menaquinone biosynthesis C-methylase UbiE
MKWYLPVASENWLTTITLCLCALMAIKTIFGVDSAIGSGKNFIKLSLNFVRSEFLIIANFIIELNQKGRIMMSTIESPAQTKGYLIRWGAFYDTVVNLLTLGQTSRLRTMTIDQAMLMPGERLLDVGCGTGGVTIPAKKRVGQNGPVSGIDPSPEMIAVARRKAERARLEIDFRIGVIESLPYEDGSFDVVTSSLMMHHLPNDVQQKGLAEIYRVLKPGGRILIADAMRPNRVVMKGFFNLIARHHGLKFGVEDMPGILKSAGFTDAALLEQHFAFIGFVRAIKPAG